MSSMVIIEQACSSGNFHLNEKQSRTMHMHKLHRHTLTPLPRQWMNPFTLRCMCWSNVARVFTGTENTNKHACGQCVNWCVGLHRKQRQLVFLLHAALLYALVWPVLWHSNYGWAIWMKKSYLCMFWLIYILVFSPKWARRWKATCEMW